MADYNGLMKLGHEAVRKGNFAYGILLYDDALGVATSPSEVATTLRSKGIALRLSGKLDDSERVLNDAYDLAHQDPILVARIERDLGMTILERAVRLKKSGQLKASAGQFADADAWLLESQQRLQHHDPVENAATTGCRARSLLERGEHHAAIAMFRSAHQALTGRHDVYELNNLVWLARASLTDRWRYASRAFRLAFRTNHTRRAEEYFVLLIGGDYLYQLLQDTWGK